MLSGVIHLFCYWKKRYTKIVSKRKFNIISFDFISCRNIKYICNIKKRKEIFCKIALLKIFVMFSFYINEQHKNKNSESYIRTFIIVLQLHNTILV